MPDTRPLYDPSIGRADDNPEPGPRLARSADSPDGLGTTGWVRHRPSGSRGGSGSSRFGARRAALLCLGVALFALGWTWDFAVPADPTNELVALVMILAGGSLATVVLFGYLMHSTRAEV